VLTARIIKAKLKVKLGMFYFRLAEAAIRTRTFLRRWYPVLWRRIHGHPSRAGHVGRHRRKHHLARAKKIRTDFRLLWRVWWV